MFDAARKIGSQFGVQGLYQGLNATFLRNIPANGAYFWAYEGARRTMTPANEEPNMAVNFAAGGLAGVGYWLSIYPLELIKTRIQSDSSVLHERKYRGIVDCAVQTLQHEGVGAFFKGFSAAMLRSFPANAFCFLGYEVAQRQLRPHFESSK